MFIRSQQLGRYVGNLIHRLDPTAVARLLGVRTEELTLAARGELSPADGERMWSLVTNPHTARALAALECRK